jgi:lysophospholipase L1-like esterase
MLGTEPPDVVTLMFGTNDCSCYPPEFFRHCVEQFLDRTTRASGGHTAVLPFATLPGLKDYATKTDPYAEVVRQAMHARHQPCFDLAGVFKARHDDAYAACFADGVHLNATGHQVVAEGILAYLVRPGTDTNRKEPQP